MCTQVNGALDIVSDLSRHTAIMITELPFWVGMSSPWLIIWS